MIGIILKISKEKTEIEDLARAVYTFIRIGPKIRKEYSPFHICCDAIIERDPTYMGRERMDEIIYFPDVELCRLFINCGARVNARDEKKNTPLHVISSCADMICDRDGGQEILQKIMTCLIENGAHIDARNEDGKTAMDAADSFEAKAILKAQNRINLACLAARVVKVYELSYKNTVPSCLHEFIELH